MRKEVGDVNLVRMIFAVACDTVIAGKLYLAGAVADPVAVTCVVRAPNGTKVTYTYDPNTPGPLVRVSRGVYTLRLQYTAPGTWGVIWTGSGAASVELVKSGEIEVAQPLFC